MNKKEFTTLADVKDFVLNKSKTGKYIFDIQLDIKLNKYTVEWNIHKEYTSFDGKQYPDEIWVTEQEEILLVQDMSEAHVRNALRMMLRRERQQQVYNEENYLIADEEHVRINPGVERVLH